MRRTGVLFAVTLMLLAVLPAASSAYVHLVTFRSPTGNIGCEMYTGVRCDIRDRDWSPPPKPRDCDLDYGQGLAVGPRGPAGFVCAGDTALDPSLKPLAYGKSITHNGYRCTSAITGVTCKRLSTGHGFFISIQSYRIF